MRIDEYLETLPRGIMGGDDVTLPDDAILQILDFADVGPGESFCHLGCGRGEALRLAATRGARVLGVDVDLDKVAAARRALGPSAVVRVGDIRECALPDADVVLFWFADPSVTHVMSARLASLDPGTRVITVWGPLPGYLPDRVRFPFVMSRVPFRTAPDMRAQIRAVFGVGCVSYATAWEYAERYTRALQPPGSGNDRFLTILQALTIWFSARSLGVACEKDVPDPVKNYVSIMRNYFGIDFGHLLEQ